MAQKGIINNSTTDPNKILPMKYPWAREHYKAGVNNNWVPEEVSMQLDIELWKKEGEGALSEEERRMILWNLGFFSTAESLTANNLVLAVYNHVTNPESRQYLLRQAYEEAIHTDTFIYCCDSLGLDPDEIYNMYETIPSIKAKDDFVVDFTKSVFDPNFKTDSSENIQKFVHDQYILRDESIHLAFGLDLIKTIREENPEIWTEEFETDIRDKIKHAVELEKAYVDDAMPNGFLGLNPQTVKDYVEFIADRRLDRLDMKAEYNTDSPFPWMAEVIDVSKEKNFFETKVTEYKNSGSLEW